MIITKKITTKYFEDVKSGVKNFELRLANFEIKSGDTLLLKEVDAETKKLTGRELSKKVTYVLKTKDITFWPKEKVDEFGYQIISLKEDE
ncbi:MAG: DUF3850 domain-containing protein [Candidatus Nanoarchaeia archaeon]|jgi:ASC-1-like (ASCH) protein